MVDQRFAPGISDWHRNLQQNKKVLYEKKSQEVSAESTSQKDC